ncbi:MAG: hypothetical protein M5U19_02695 [Microthrixaceae bacterium]|nr:hypothetical protein [Microthrixaceae bacterium]
MEHTHPSGRLEPAIWDYGYHSLRQLAGALRSESDRCADGLLIDLGCGGEAVRTAVQGPHDRGGQDLSPWGPRRGRLRGVAAHPQRCSLDGPVDPEPRAR